MPTSLLFWLIFVIVVLFTGIVSWPFNRANAPALAVLILIALLGYRVFGPLLQ